MHKQYALAIYSLLKEKKFQNFEENLHSFFGRIKDKGKEKLLPGILRELERLFERENKSAPKIYIASDKFKSAAEEKAKEFGIENASFEKYETLIGGFVVRKSDFLYDASYKKWLLDFYKSMKNI